MIRNYSDLCKILTIEDRFEYLKLSGRVGSKTFGFDRYINQKFYKSQQWTNIRNSVIVRDCGFDLGVTGYTIGERILVHHMNPIDMQDLVDGTTDILDPEFLISVSHQTHLAIHFGDKRLLPSLPISRTRGDTTLW